MIWPPHTSRLGMHLIPVVIALSSFSFLTEAIPWPGVAPTPIGQVPPAYLAWTPRPTAGPELRRRLIQPRDLFGRQASSRDPRTCGYVNGNHNIPVTCAEGMSCVADKVRSAVACCPSLSAKDKECGGGIFTSCIARTASCDNGCVSDELILKCTFTLQPACYTYKFENGYIYYGCWSTSFSSAVKLTYSGETLASSVSLTTRPTTSESSASQTTSQESNPLTSPNQVSTVTNAMPPPTDIPTSTPIPSSNIGTIAGATVGGLAVLAGFILGLVYLRNKRHNESHDLRETITRDAIPRETIPQPPSSPPTTWRSMQFGEKTVYGSPGDIQSQTPSQYTSGIPAGHMSHYEPRGQPPFELDVATTPCELRLDVTTPATSPLQERSPQQHF